MGFFSKTCAKTHWPIVALPVGIPRLNEVVALLPDGRKVSGPYDGYGRVGGVDVRETEDGKWVWEKVKMVVAEHYNGEEYNDLGKSHDELAQGYFMSDKFLHYCLLNGPFKSHAEYKKAFKKLADW